MCVHMYIYICVCTYVCVYIHICVVMANPLRFPLQLHCRAKVLLTHEHHEWKIDVFAPAGPDDGEEGGPLYEKHGVLLAMRHARAAHLEVKRKMLMNRYTVPWIYTQCTCSTA